MGTGDVAFARLIRVNDWTADDGTAYVNLSFDMWEIRSAVEWRLDLRWLATRGIEPPEPERPEGSDSDVIAPSH
jgi:hypothetical protein